MKKRKNKENKESRLYYLNHKNLIGEIENYGYVFKFRKLLFTYLCVLAGCILAGLAVQASSVRLRGNNCICTIADTVSCAELL